MTSSSTNSGVCQINVVFDITRSMLARTLLKGYQPVAGWPSEHIPTRRPAAQEKWKELRAAAGLS